MAIKKQTKTGTKTAAPRKGGDGKTTSSKSTGRAKAPRGDSHLTKETRTAMTKRARQTLGDSDRIRQAKVAISKMVSSASFNWNDDSRGYALVSIIREGIDFKTFQAVAERIPVKGG